MAHPLRIVFMGSPDFAVPTLERLHQTTHKVVSVISGTDKRRSRRGEPVPTPVKQKALDLGLSTFDADEVKDPALHSHLKELNADLFVVVAFKILPQFLLDIPSHGSVNLHASLLPKYRGAAPIHWAVINGEEQTGCTVFFLDRGVDTGNIIKQKKISIGPDETTGDVYERLKLLGAKVMTDAVEEIASGTVIPWEQDERNASGAPKLFKENTRINFDKPAADLHNFIRGLNPFPVAWCMYGNKKMNVYKSRIGPYEDLNPGEFSFSGNKLLAGTGDGTIELLKVQLPGTKKMSGPEFANGYNLDITLQ